MSIKIEDIYDAIKTIVTTECPTRLRISNPYFLYYNSILMLKNGYGIRVDGGRNTERLVGCQATWERLFTVIISNQITNTQNDVNSQTLVEKNLLIDHDKLLQAFEKNVTLNGTGIKATFADDGGITPIESEKSLFLTMEISIYVEYLETLT